MVSINFIESLCEKDYLSLTFWAGTSSVFVPWKCFSVASRARDGRTVSQNRDGGTVFQVGGLTSDLKWQGAGVVGW